MITLEKILTELKAESVNEIVGGNGKKKSRKTKTNTDTRTKSMTDRRTITSKGGI